jgi:hypothetical protein
MCQARLWWWMVSRLGNVDGLVRVARQACEPQISMVSLGLHALVQVIGEGKP